MKEESNAQLESIRRGVWAILGVLLLMFGFDNTPIRRSELGDMIAMIGLVAGILMISFALGAMVFRFLVALKQIADGEKNP
jgi:ABC-type arginine transport system permease subunit